MPPTLTYPGVYIEEIPSGVHTIVGVSTSNTAFVDWFPKGPTGVATRVTSFADFVRQFGGLDSHSEASYAIQQYYLNGGQVAWVIRVVSGAGAASVDLLPDAAGSEYFSGPQGGSSLNVAAASEGSWGNGLQVRVTAAPLPTGQTPMPLFNLLVRLMAPGATGKDPPLTVESYLNLSMDPHDVRYAESVVNAQSALIRLSVKPDPLNPPRPPAVTPFSAPDPLHPLAPVHPLWVALGSDNSDLALKGLTATPVQGKDGDVPPNGAGIRSVGPSPLNAPSNWSDNGGQALLDVFQTTLPLDKIAPDIFNILCIPAAAKLPDPWPENVYSAALQYCHDKRAFLILDLPDGLSLTGVSGWLDARSLRANPNGAVYYPNLIISDLLAKGRDRRVGPSGTLAGIYARTDSGRGVWKAPAGVEAVLVGARLPENLGDLDIGEINPEGINALRGLTLIGQVCWGARTLFGADQLASEWKYIPIRRLALYLEESLYEATKWVVFEPNDEPLWASIRLNVGAFMHHLFVQGAFQGQAPKDAYFVKCDAETTTQADRDLGVVNIVVGFAPLKPAEFVVIQIQQIAGAIQT